MQIVGILLVAAMMVLPVASGQTARPVVRGHAAMVGRASASGRVVVGLASSRRLGLAPGRHDRARRRAPCSLVVAPSRRHTVRAAGSHAGDGRTHDAAGARDLHAVVGRASARVGQRYTAKRRGLVTMLERADKPLSIGRAPRGADRSRRARSTATSSVLEQAGVVRRVITDEEFARYELDRGAHGAPPPPDLLELRPGGGRHDPGRLRDHDGPDPRPARPAHRLRQGAPPARPDRHLSQLRCASCETGRGG